MNTLSQMGGGVLEEAAYWHTLLPGESLRLVRNRWATSSEESPGTYKFRAYYVPPLINRPEQELLIKAGIDPPRSNTRSARFVFVRTARP